MFRAINFHKFFFLLLSPKNTWWSDPKVRIGSAPFNIIPHQLYTVNYTILRDSPNRL